MKGWSPFTQKSAFKQSTGAATVTTSDGKKVEYPPVGYLGQKEYSSVLNSLPGSVFKGGKNTGDVDDVNRDAYSKYLGNLGKTDGDD